MQIQDRDMQPIEVLYPSLLEQFHRCCEEGRQSESFSLFYDLRSILDCYGHLESCYQLTGNHQEVPEEMMDIIF